MGGLQVQDDHFWRLADICFRHLSSAFQYREEQSPHKWIVEVSNDDVRFGRSDYMKSRSALNWAQSQEYTHAIAATVFAQAWILSAANFYCQSNPNVLGKQFKSPEQLSKALGAPSSLRHRAKDLRELRNKALHLYEGEDGGDLADLDCTSAFRHVETTWLVYEALLRKFGVTPDHGAWEIQMSRYGLPANLDE